MGVSGLTDFIEKKDKERNVWRLVLIEGEDGGGGVGSECPYIPHSYI